MNTKKFYSNLTTKIYFVYRKLFTKQFISLTVRGVLFLKAHNFQNLRFNIKAQISKTITETITDDFAIQITL